MQLLLMDIPVSEKIISPLSLALSFKFAYTQTQRTWAMILSFHLASIWNYKPA